MSLWHKLQRHRTIVLGIMSALMTIIMLPLVLGLAIELNTARIGADVPILAGMLFKGVLVVGVLAVVSMLFWWVSREKAKVLVPLEDQPPLFPGLIALVGPGPRTAQTMKDKLKQGATKAIQYHLMVEGQGPPLQADEQGPKLKVCWLITTLGEKGGLPVAEELRRRYGDKCKIIVRTIGDAYGVEAMHSTYELVERIYTVEAKGQGLNEEDIIADFTGGTAPMTAGAVLACGNRRDMEYVTGGGLKPVVSVPIHVRFERRPVQRVAPPEADPTD